MYPRLTSPGSIGNVIIPNRVVMTAASCSLSLPDGTMTPEMLAYYTRRAQGGVGLIITEMVCVDEICGILFPRELSAAKEERIHDFRQLADAVHAYGTKLFPQLFHPGRNADPLLNMGGVLAADPGVGKKHGVARAATEADLDRIVTAFGQAARRVQEAGVDGVEIHAAHHYLIHHFLSPVSNHRTDSYGGTLENRTRLLRRIVTDIRRTCGQSFPIMVRISLEEYIGKEGYHADTGIKICQMLEQWGVDAINVTASGTVSKLSQSVEPISYQQGWRKHLLRAVKKTVNIPVCGVAVVRDPAFAEALLEQGYTDFVGSARAHLADPDWMVKAKNGLEKDILPCISCMACFARYDSVGHISCAVNPETGFETQLPPLNVDGARRPVVVLGAGPAGLEAAWIAAKRGFSVTVWETSDAPGGQLKLAAAVPRKEKMQWLLDSLVRRCEQAGVVIRCGVAPSTEELCAIAPYAILDATGGKPNLPNTIEGVAENPLVCTPTDIILGKCKVREESVVVVGSGMTGLETAEILCQREWNNAVLVLEAAGKIAPGVYGSNRNTVTAVLEIHNVVFLLQRTLTKIGEDRIWFQDSLTGEEYVYPCDRVVLAAGVVPARPYGEELKTVCDQVIRIGDAVRSGGIWNATRDGYLAALQI